MTKILISKGVSEQLKSVFEKVLAGLLQMELVSSASSRRQARWAFIVNVSRNLDSYLRCLRVAPIFVYLQLSLFDDRVSANDAMMTNDHQSKLVPLIKRRILEEMSVIRKGVINRDEFVETALKSEVFFQYFFIHGVHGLALAVPYPFFLQVLLNVLSSASWL